MITSRSNPQIKRIRQLMESAKERRREGLFVTEGLRITREADPERIEKVYLSETAEKEASSEAAFLSGLPQEKVEVVADAVFRSLSDTVNPQGILAVVRQPSYTLADVQEYRLFVLLDDVRDPGNLGTIVRTAEAAGAAVLMSPSCADIFNPKVIRSTMGSIFRVPFFTCPLPETIFKLREEGVTVCAAALDGAVDYREVRNAERIAFVIGNEANGISQPVLQAAPVRVKIPMSGKVESLNAAVSAAILMYSVR